MFLYVLLPVAEVTKCTYCYILASVLFTVYTQCLSVNVQLVTVTKLTFQLGVKMTVCFREKVWALKQTETRGCLTIKWCIVSRDTESVTSRSAREMNVDMFESAHHLLLT